MWGTNTRANLVGNFEKRLMTFWSRWRAPKVVKNPQPIINEPVRKSTAYQWTVLEDHLRSEAARAQSVVQMQETATLHLDAAHYALDRIAVELVDVMPSIMMVASVQPPRIQAVKAPIKPTNVPMDHSIAA